MWKISERNSETGSTEVKKQMCKALISGEKKEIRKQVLALRDSLSDDERQRGNILVTEKILGHQWYYGAEYLLLFANYRSEIDTSMILEDALQKGKKVFLPKVEDNNMVFYRIWSPEDLRKGYKGIPEPAGDTDYYSGGETLAEKTLMIMPGAAFDVKRRRIGYGGGFYDRYLQDKPWMRTIAIGYKCQMLEEIPTEDTDIRPGQVICL